jgi:glycogen debranching enzyme
MIRPLDAVEPAQVVTEAGTLTLIDGTTFCVSARTGDMTPGGPSGLYFRDTRVLSRWQLTLDGHGVEILSVRPAQAFAARFIARRPPAGGRADSTLLVVRERLLGDGLREAVTVENLGPEATAVTLIMHADADFADLFAVKGGRPAATGAHATVAAGELVLRDRTDGSRGLRLTATGDPVPTPGGLSWRVLVPPRGSWSTEIVAQPIVDGHPVEPRFRPGERVDLTAPGLEPGSRRTGSTSLSADDRRLAAALRRTRTDLGSLRIDGPGEDEQFVAAGAPWFMTLFGRDSLLTAWMALPLDPDLALGTLRTLASLQGRRTDPVTEEEPGRILHERRRGPDHAEAIGGRHYYGTVDATPLFVMLLAEAWRWGADEAAVRHLLPAADAALEWLHRHGDRDGDGFVEYRRATDRGLTNQGWKDSADGINDARGRPGEPPIALAEVQGYAYAALLARADLAAGLGDGAAAAGCRERAGALRERFNDRFWLPDRGWYAVALDRHKRPLDALTSNPGHCLWTGIVDDGPAERLVAHLGGSEMDSGYGLRTLATGMGAYNPMSYHNGSVWPHDTALCVAGLMRYPHVPGAVELAHRLADGLLDAAEAFGGRLPELFCGFPRERYAPPVPYPTSCSPQAWASAAPLLLVRAFLGLDPQVPHGRVSLSPHLPGHWGTVRLDDLRLGPARLRVEAAGGTARVHGEPAGWTVTVAAVPAVPARPAPRQRSG